MTNRKSDPTALPPGFKSETPYTADQWEEDAFAVFAEGRDPPACPACSQTGFYGPRVTPDGERYRGCRFCGFYQEIGGPAGRAQACVHGCGPWPEIARAPYIWWAPPGTDTFVCPFCDATVATSSALTEPPSDNPDHPWWRVPQQRTRFYYARFWENWPYTKGRTFL